MTGDVQRLSRSGIEGGEEGGCEERFGEKGAGGGRLREMEELQAWHRDGGCHWMKKSSQCEFHSQELRERERGREGSVGGRCRMGTHINNN